MAILIMGVEMPESCPCKLVGVGYDLYCSFTSGIPSRMLEYIECCEKGTRPDWCPLVEVVRTGEGLYDTYTPPDKETAKHVTEVFRKSTERMEAEE